MKQQYLEVGKITNVHGLMGEVRVQPWADSPDFLCRFKTLYVDETHWPIQVERARVHKNMVILKLEGITDVNGALALRNAIMRPLNKLMSFASDCAGGNRDCTVDIERRDEFGKLAEALRSMVGHLNNQLAFSESVLNGLPVPTAIYTAENMLRFANRHMMNLLEAEGRPEDYYGRSSGDFLFRDPDRETASVRCLRSGQPEAKELPFTTYKGEARYALTQAAPLFDDHGRLTSVLSIWIDTTDAHKRQKEIEQAHTTMMEVANSSRQVAESLASASEELILHKPDITRRELLLSGFSVGRSVIGTMTTTLMLAYSGNYLSMLMYFAGQGTPVMDVLNLKYVASQLMNTLVGSFGLVAAAPLTAIAASMLYTGHARKRAALRAVAEDAPALQDAPEV